MAQYLDTVDITKPNGATEPVSTLDNYAREMRDATKNTMGVEHTLTGEHKFLRGDTASRPAPTVATNGRLYFNSEALKLQMVVAGAWVDVATLLV